MPSPSIAASACAFHIFHIIHLCHPHSFLLMCYNCVYCIILNHSHLECSQSHTVTILPQSELKKYEDEEKRKELEKEIRECDEVMNI